MLYEVRERGGGIRHGVRAVRDDESVVRLVIFFDDARKLQPMAGREIGAVEIKRLNGFNVALRRDLGHMVEQIARGDDGLQSAAHVFRGDRAARCDHEYLFQLFLLLSLR